MRTDRTEGNTVTLRGATAELLRCVGLILKLRGSSQCAHFDCAFETAWLSVTNLNGRRFNLLTVYKPHNRSLARFSADLDCLETQVQRVLLSSTDPVVVTGALNCNLLGSDDPCKLRMLQLLENLSLPQHVRTPTYRSGSLLDVFITNAADFTSDINVHPGAYSDHSFLTARISIPKIRAKPRVTYSRQFYKMDVEAFYCSLYGTDWSPVFSCLGVTEQ